MWHRTQQGDHVAFRHLADRLYRSLFNYAFTFTHDREFIKDTIQELLISIWRKRERIQIEFVRIYFLRSMRNQLSQELRRTKGATDRLDIEECNGLSDFKNIESDIIRDEIASGEEHRLRAAVAMLPKRQREVVFLKYYEGLDNDKIAGLMHIHKQSVSNLLFKAVASLKEQITW